ncbi:hypothetical protein WME88_30885 [Sorangium sp. So ce216]
MVLGFTDSWWLDTSGLPDLLWARLRLFSDGTAEVLDLDGKRTQFRTEAEARELLREDEYQRVDLLEQADVLDAGVQLATLVPPEADDDAALIPRMLVRSSTAPAGRDVSKQLTSESKRRRDRRNCPVCLTPLVKNAGKTRRRRGCTTCGAHPQRTKSCRRCSATAGAIWQGRSGAACSTCGLYGPSVKVIRIDQR